MPWLMQAFLFYHLSGFCGCWYSSCTGRVNNRRFCRSRPEKVIGTWFQVRFCAPDHSEITVMWAPKEGNNIVMKCITTTTTIRNGVHLLPRKDSCFLFP